MNEFGLRWTEARGRNGRLVTKEKLFRTRTARDHWADLVAEKPAFIRFEAWLAAIEDADDAQAGLAPTD